MTQDEKKAKRREYLRLYAIEWRKNHPEKEGEYRRRVWEKKLKQEQDDNNKKEA